MKITKIPPAPLLLCAFALSMLFSIPSTTIAQENREILRLGRGTASALDWRPDGEVLAVGGGTGIWLYDENFEVLAHLYANVGNFTNVRWSPDGSRLAALTGSSESILQMWRISNDALNGEVVWTQADISAWDISWKPDGTQFATTDDNHLLRIWDATSGTVMRQIPNVGLFGMVWSPDGKWVAGTVYGASFVKIWDPDTGEAVMTLEGIVPELSWSSLAWSPDGQKLAGVTSLPASLHIWDTSTGALLNDPDATSDMYVFRAVLWSPDGKQIITAGGNVESDCCDSIYLWDAATSEIINSNGIRGIKELALRPKGDLLAVLGWRGQISIWNPSTMKLIRSNQFHTLPQTFISWSPQSDKIVTTQDAAVSIWTLSFEKDLQNGQPILAYDTSRGDYSTSYVDVRWIADNELLSIERTGDYSGNMEIGVFRRSASNANILATLLQLFTRCGYSISSDFEKIACHDNEGLQIYEIGEQDPILTIPLKSAYSIDWSPDDTVIAVIRYTDDGQSIIAEFWSTRDGFLLQSFESAAPYSPVWSPDGKHIALALKDDDSTKLHVIDAVTYETITIIDTYGQFTWSPDSHTIALSTDNSIDFYDVITGSLIESAPAQGVSTLAWSPDGQMLALAAYDGTIRTWDVSDFEQAQ